METSTTTSTLALIGDTPDAVDRLAKKCRALTLAAEWLDEHGVELPVQPSITTTYSHTDHVELTWHVHFETDNADLQKAMAAAIVRVVGGAWKKDGNDERLYLDQHDDERIRFSIIAERSAVCERVVTGTHEVTVPAVEAQPERVEVVEDVEWICAPILGGAA